MESIYKLQGRAAELAALYDEAYAEFEALMEENGGEINEESQEYIDYLARLEELQEESKKNFEELPDAYAAWFKNIDAEKKVAAAELKAFKDLQKSAVSKYESRVNGLERKGEWVKQNIADAMRLLNVERLDKKSRPGSLFSIYFQDVESVEVDEALALQDYEEEIERLNAILPEGFTVTIKIDKAALKNAESVPAGVTKVVRQSLQIR